MMNILILEALLQKLRRRLERLQICLMIPLKYIILKEKGFGGKDLLKEKGFLRIYGFSSLYIWEKNRIISWW